MAVKKGVKEQKKKERRACCAKNRVWIGVGCVAFLIALILALVLVIRSLIATRESNQTIKELKACLSGIDVSKGMTELVVPNNRCNDMTDLNMGAFTKLKLLSIGNDCFENVSELDLVGLSALERVVIGENSFTKQKTGYGNDPNRQFYLRNCPTLKELKVGRYSFSDYSVIEIEKVGALEVIAMGELNEASYNFYSASLELRSLRIHSK